jgi:hypothetical protein
MTWGRPRRWARGGCNQILWGCFGRGAGPGKRTPQKTWLHPYAELIFLLLHLANRWGKIKPLFLILFRRAGPQAIRRPYCPNRTETKHATTTPLLFKE